MVWKLELVGPGHGEPTRLLIAELGAIVAPGRLDEVGLPHSTAQKLVVQIQRHVVAAQESALRRKAEELRRLDPSLRLKDYRPRCVHTLHGSLTIRVPRFRRVGSALPAPVLVAASGRRCPAYASLLARLGSWMSFRDAATLLAELFPDARGSSFASIRRRVGGEAARLQATPKDAGAPAATSIDIGVDTTFVRSCEQGGPRHHEVLIGVATADKRRTLCIGGVIAAVQQPHTLIDEALADLGRTNATRITAFTDGDRMLRGYLARAGIVEKPILDWPHVARRAQVAKTTAKGLKALTDREKRARPAIGRLLESVQWRLWHGQTDRARKAFAQIERRLDAFDIKRIRPGRTAAPARRLLRSVTALRDYIDGQSAYLVDYASRQRKGQTISTSTSESLANALVNKRLDKRQQMRWSAAGAHAVVSVRADTRNRRAIPDAIKAMAIAA